MFSFQQKVSTKSSVFFEIAKKHQGIIHTEGKKQSGETVSKCSQMLNFTTKPKQADKEASINMFKELKEAMFKKIEV